METFLVFVCLMSCVSCMNLKPSGADAHLRENDPDTHLPGMMNKVILEHIYDLLDDLKLTCKPDSKFEKILFCTKEVRVKHAECKKICEEMESLWDRLKCNSVMFTRFTFGCFSTEIECWEPEGNSMTANSRITSTTTKITKAGFNNGEQILEIAEELEDTDLDDDSLARRFLRDSSESCDFTQFGPTHSAVLAPKEECEKFKLLPGEIYRRGVSEEDIQAILNTHNEMRSKVAGGNQTRGNPGPQPSAANMREMIWNDQLAISAQGWADQCAVKHDKRDDRQTCERKQVGQNVGHTKSNKDNKPSTVYWEKIINSFHNEVDNMPDYAVDEFKKPPNGVIGHYTQVVWAKTYEVGCGVVYYYLYEQTNKGILKRRTARSFVCNYAPSGNYKKAKVYERGPPASNCNNGVSSSYPNLCAPPAN